MKKSVRNLVLGAVMTVGVVAGSMAAFAYTQYTQSDMNFRNGPSTTATVIGSVPAGAQVDVQGSQNGWDIISYNGLTGYIHGGNLADSYTAPAPSQTATQNYYNTNWTLNAANMADYDLNSYMTVYVDHGYLALRSVPDFNSGNEIAQLHTGDRVEIINSQNSGSYVQVYCPALGLSGWVNSGFLGE